MSWTYTADPTSSTKDAVRFLIGDTDEANPLLQDEEIYFNLNEVNGEPYRAAANACENLAALFTGLAQSSSKSVGGLSLSQSYGDRAQRFTTLGKLLLSRSRRVNPPTISADPNALGAELKIGMFDRYVAYSIGWPTGSALGVSTTYGTGGEPGGENG